jgi:glycosyltransferase involved in cell wall biosynthesis
MTASSLKTSLKPSLSVIIPARDAAETIGAQLTALASQVCSIPWEVIVVDNNSSDNTAELARSHASAFTRFKVVVADNGTGAAYARNAGVAATSTRWLAFCDADDIVKHNWLTNLVEALENHSFVSGPIELDRLNPPWLAESRGRSFSNTRTTFEGVFPFASSCNMAMTRHLFNQVGGFDESLRIGEDIDISLKVWQQGIDLHFEPGAGVHYRLRDQLGPLFRQSLEYGAVHPVILEQLRRSGHDVPSRTKGVRTWGWLVRNLPLLRSQAGRARWLWVAGRQVGRLRGGPPVRRLYI